LFQLLTGQLPFTGDYSIVQKILNEKHPPLNQFLEKYPSALDAMIDRSMAKNPDERYATADEMAAEIASLTQDLKKEQVAEWIQRAERLVQQEQYTNARDVLLQLLKVDSQHTLARQLIAQVQHNLTLRQRAEQIRQLRTLADQAIHEKHYEEAIDYLQQACGIDPSSSELAELLESVRQKKRRRELIDGYLREADQARDRGDLDGAGAVISKALEVDRDDSRVRAAHVALARLLEEAARQAKAKKLLEDARKEISSRHFTAAMEVLAEIERVDPANPELIALQAAARSGREQEQRRRILEQLQNEVSLASTVEELMHVSQLIHQALERMPAEPMLIKLKGHVARQLREQEVRRRVDELAVRCRSLMETAPEDALKLVRRALEEAPSNERLLALQTTITAHMTARNQEQLRAQYLTRAHEALSTGRYTDALRLLESCQKEGLSSPEIAELIDFARQEADRGMKSSQIQGLLRQAQDLMSRGSYAAVVELLTPIKDEQGAASLLFLLEDARNRVESIQRQIDATLHAVDALSRQEQYEAALKFLESQPPHVLTAEAAQRAMSRLRVASEKELLALRAVGAGYAALDRMDLRGQVLSSQPGESSFLARVVPIFAARRTALADRQVSSAIEKARAAIEAGDKKLAVKILTAASSLTNFASGHLQKEWESLHKSAEKGGMFRKRSK
jgi:eukaryotic-like serine/threonine-protein kinase